MSQAIRKYENSGKIEKPEETKLVEWEGVGKYNLDDLASTAIKNKDTYFSGLGLKGERLSNALASADKLIQGLRSGTIRRKADGSFEDTTGQLSSTGEYGKKKFLGIKTGIKEDENTGMNDAAAYLADIFNKANTYEAPKPAEKEIFNVDLSSELSKPYYSQLTDPKNKMSVITGILRKSLLQINQPDFDTKYKFAEGIESKEDYTNKLNTLISNLEDNKYNDNDLLAANAIGLSDIGRYLNMPSRAATNKPEGLSDEAWKAQQELDKIRQAKEEQKPIAELEQTKRLQQAEEDYRKFQDLANANVSKFKPVTLPKVTPYNFDAVYKSRTSKDTPWNLSQTFASYNTDPNAVLKGQDIVDELGNDIRNTEGGMYGVPDRTANQRLANDLDYYIKESERIGEEVEMTSQGEYVIPQTYDAKTGLIRVYNKTTGTIRYVPAYTTKFGKSQYKAEYERSKPGYDSYKKEGGVLIAQQGGTVGYNEADERARRIEKATKLREQEEQEALANQPKSDFKNDKQLHAKQGWSTADSLRLGALGGDVASLVASMTGVGSIASAGLGVASTAANQAADMQEGMGFWKSLGNNAVSYGLDALSLVPFAKAAKVPSMMRKAASMAPKVIGVLAMGQGAMNSPAYIESWTKVKDGKNLTVEDWRNISNSLQLLVGGTAATTRAAKTNKRINAAISPDSQLLKTNQGYQKVDIATIDKLRKTTGLDAQNKLIQSKFGPDFSLPEAKSTVLRKRKGEANIDTQAFYDLSKPVTTYSGDLPINYTFTKGEQRLGNAKIEFPEGRKLYNKVFHPQASKRQAEANMPKRLPATVKGNTSTETPPPGGYRMVNMNESATKPISTLVNKPSAIQETPVAKAQASVLNTPTNVQTSNMDADAIVRGKSVTPSVKISDFISQRLPSKTKSGIAREKARQKYESVFGERVQQQNDADWDLMVKENPSAGYYETGPKRSIYEPKQGTELTMQPKEKPKETGASFKQAQAKIDKEKSISNAMETRKKASQENTLPHKSKKDTPKSKKKEAKGYVNKKESGGLIEYLADGKPIYISGTTIPGTPALKFNPVERFGAPEQLIQKLQVSSELKPLQVDRSTLKQPSIIRVGQQQPISKSKIEFMPEDIIAAGRMVGGLVTNARVAEKYKSGLKPTLLNTYENYVPLQGDYANKSAAYNQAAQLESLASRPRTSDASLQLAGQLEAGNRSATLRMQGDAADADRYYQTRLMGQQESDAAKARRVEIANQNRGAVNAIGAAKAQIDSAKIGANYQQVVAPWMAGIENQYRQKRAMNDQLNLEMANSLGQTQFASKMQPLSDAYNKAWEEYRKQNPQASIEEFNANKGKTYIDQLNALKQSSYLDSLRQRQQMLGSPWLYTKTSTMKKGGKLTFEEKQILQRAKDFNKRLRDDNKQFHKDILEAKKEQAKLIASMSSITASLIKRGIS